MENNFPQPERVLVISAHPDDPEFHAGGLIARWAKQGAQVTCVIVTDGSKGSSDPDMTIEKLVQTRQEEQNAAAQVLGVVEVVFLGHPDGEVYNTPDLRRDLARQIRIHRPEVVITHDPTARILRNTRITHPDHRAVGDAALDAVFPLARDRLNFPEHEQEGLQPHKVLDIFLSGSNEPNMTVDVTDTIEQKIAAICEHRSQISEPEKLAERIRQFLQQRAEGTSFKYAEQFRRVLMGR